MFRINIREFVSKFGHPGRTLNKREISRFCGQLKMLLSSGVPLIESLGIIQNMARHKEYEKIIERISEGELLAEAMKDYFPPMVISSLEGAEKAGNLEEVLAKLSKYYEDQTEVEEKIKSAMIYPCFVILLCFASLVIIFLFVLPGFKTLFLDLGTELPLFSRMLISTGDFFSATWHITSIFILILLVFLFRYKKTEKGALRIDKLFLRIKFFAQEQIVHAFRMLGSLLDGGVPIIAALEATINSSTNRAFKKIVFEIKQSVENGEKLNRSFAKHKLFPKEAVQMLAVGENSGTLSEMLLGISNFYEKEREIFIKRVTTLLEPALTVTVGVVVGLIALAMFLPMMNVISTLQ